MFDSCLTFDSGWFHRSGSAGRSITDWSCESLCRGNDVSERFARTVVDVLETNVDQHDLYDLTAALNSFGGLELVEKTVTALMRGCPNMTKNEFVAVVWRSSD